MSIDLSQLITSLSKNYPTWVSDGLDKSSAIKNMEKSLQILSKQTAKDLSEQKKQEKLLKETNFAFDKVSGSAKDAASSFDKVASSAEKSASKHAETIAKHGKTVLGHTTNFAKTLRSSGLGDAVKGLGSVFGNLEAEMLSTTGLLLGSFSAIGVSIGEFIKLVEDNNSSLVKLAENGITVGESFTGLTDSAINANMGFDNYTKALEDNADILAITGDVGAKNMSSFIRSVQFGDRNVFKLGYTLDQATAEFTTWQHIQKINGMLEGRNKQEQAVAFQGFLQDLTELSTVLGVSRQQIADSVKKSSEDPLWESFIASASEGTKKAYTEAAKTISGLTKDPELAAARLKLLQEMTITGGVPISEATTELWTDMNQLNGAPGGLRDLFYTVSENVRAGNVNAVTQANLTDTFVSSAKIMDNQTATTMQLAKVGGQSVGLMVQDNNTMRLLNKDKMDENKKAQDIANQRTALLLEFNRDVNLLENFGMQSFVKMFGFFGNIFAAVQPAFDGFLAWLNELTDPKNSMPISEMIGNFVGSALKWSFIELFKLIKVILNPMNILKVFEAIFEETWDIIKSFIPGFVDGILGIKPSSDKKTSSSESTKSDSTNATDTSKSPTTTGSNSTLGMRNNNPGNLRASPFSNGSNKGFSTFSDLATGLSAEDWQLQRYGTQAKFGGQGGYNTLSGIASHWAPRSENNTAAYIAGLSKSTGFDANQPIDLNDPTTRKRVAEALNKQEGNGAANSSTPNSTASVDSTGGSVDISGYLAQQTQLLQSINITLDASKDHLRNISNDTKNNGQTY